MNLEDLLVLARIITLVLRLVNLCAQASMERRPDGVTFWLPLPKATLTLRLDRR